MRRLSIIVILCIGLMTGCLKESEMLRGESSMDKLTAEHKINIPVHEMNRVRNLQEQKMESLHEDALLGTHLGIIVPHHLLAADWIGATFHQIKAFNPEIVVLMAPNHREKALAQIITHTSPMVVMKQHFQMDPSIQVLIEKGLAAANNEAFDYEHGIYNLIPFIEFQEWDATLVPLILARDTGVSELENLLEVLESETEGRRVLWVASIDFSHYLPAAAAGKKDKETQRWIAENDFDAIMASTDKHLDAPAVLSLWLKKFETTKLLWHSNSAEIVNDGYMIGGTSYMIYYGY